MTGNSLTYQIALTFIKGVGNLLAKTLIAYVGSVEGIFSEKAQSLGKIPGIGRILSTEIVSQRDAALVRAEREIEFITKNDINPCFFTDSEYPFRLKECPDSPIMLYGKGNLELNNKKFVGIVGTRNATDEGRANCKKLVSDIAAHQSDVVIISGLAYGIDICAHKAALDAGLPTIGVLAHGLDRIYPAAHRSIAAKMQHDGGLLTEFATETNADKPNFVQRNRIIAGMCDALVVVESNKKGGSLITANMANDYNRDVFAFPGRVTDEFSAGCNALIKSNKAALIESAEDMLRFMNWENSKDKTSVGEQTSLFVDLTNEEEDILSVLKQYPDGIQTNELAIRLSRPFSKISSILLSLEFKNMVKCLPGNVYKIMK
ncbi:DNA-protecting protein DprA [Paludibacter sp. 221]|uniref:DNA-processing protein DprA n=1 Tax=Paludibacter sp. 221 TaxID=2302939 RepID=UPI0013D5646E|nr:DNA-processing protein DprA [Paludibacter sp. 221]NDV46759.1 DNA-protecting protein DprA [Paludibacter sp. 221]